MVADHVVMLSGGVSSYLAAKRVAPSPGRLYLLFADTLMEDPDLYRFLDDIERSLGPITRLQDGRTPWDVFEDVRFLGNSRVDPCSRILKRELLRRWLTEHCDPTHTTVYLGFDWDEQHRIDRARAYWTPWTVAAPLSQPPYLSRDAMFAEARADGLRVPELYRLGFHHNNCGGFCVKAGHAQFAHLLRVLPERYTQHEEREAQLRQKLGDVSILTDRRGGETRPLTLTAFRERIEAGGTYDQLDFGACSCFEEPRPQEGVA